MVESFTLVIGLGEIGRPLAGLIEKAGLPLQGVDIEPQDAAGPVGVMHVCYPFQVDENFVKTTQRYVDKYKPELTIINSTVAPGTTRTIESQTNAPVVYSPVRGKHERMAMELQHYRKFVAGTSKEAVAGARAHFEAVSVSTDTMAIPEALEIAKLLETTYFGLLIAWAQDMERMCREVDADYLAVTRFFEEIGYLPRHVFLPGHIGGHCVMPNIEILKASFDSDLLTAMKRSNDRKAKELGLAPGEEGSRVKPVGFGE